jgi:hypothetical protein
LGEEKARRMERVKVIERAKIKLAEAMTLLM